MPELERSHNAASALHPHEPEIPPALDAEGRCHVCGLTVQLNEARADIERMRQALQEVESMLPAIQRNLNGIEDATTRGLDA